MRIKRAVVALLVGSGATLLASVSLANQGSVKSVTAKQAETMPSALTAEHVSPDAHNNESRTNSNRPKLFSTAHANEVAAQPTLSQSDRGIPVMLIYILGALVLSMVTLSKERGSNE